MKPNQFVVSNICGGNAKTFAIRGGEIPGAAVRYACSIGYGGPVFSGPAGELASILCLLAQDANDAAEVAA